MNIALIMAGGLGLRMGQGINMPKQFFKLADKPVLVHTLEKFENHPDIDVICIVYLTTWEGYLQEVLEHYNIKKVRNIVPGGNTRHDSVYNGLCTLEKYYSSDDIVLVHDGVRPFITAEIISKNIEVVQKYGNAMTSMRCSDSIVYSDDDFNASSAAQRDTTFSVQTPQSYKLGYGLSQYRKAISIGKVPSINCCELFISLGDKIHIVHGLKTNIKMTTEEDMAFIQAMNDIYSRHSENESIRPKGDAFSVPIDEA